MKKFGGLWKKYSNRGKLNGVSEYLFTFCLIPPDVSKAFRTSKTFKNYQKQPKTRTNLKSSLSSKTWKTPNFFSRRATRGLRRHGTATATAAAAATAVAVERTTSQNYNTVVILFSILFWAVLVPSQVSCQSDLSQTSWRLSVARAR